MKIAINNLYNNMKKESIIYCSLNAYSHYYRKHGKYAGDGLWNVRLKTDKLNYNLLINFVKKKDIKKNLINLFAKIKFSINKYKLMFSIFNKKILFKIIRMMY